MNGFPGGCQKRIYGEVKIIKIASFGEVFFNVNSFEISPGLSDILCRRPKSETTNERARLSYHTLDLEIRDESTVGDTGSQKGKVSRAGDLNNLILCQLKTRNVLKSTFDIIFDVIFEAQKYLSAENVRARYADPILAASRPVACQSRWE
ncbi:hypothetical protein PUN28_012229 [Cardiocondyla obscurior]|uniref:Uncharacterized protein n=1 Tax=Cardiocondyla obscurior TaxID=286306 RepID=A0AAW2FCU2_9HYME